MTDSLLVFLVELTVWDPAIQSSRVLRYASGQGFVTAPSDTPPNAFYEARVSQAALLSRDIFDTGTLSGESRVGYGDLVLANGDSGLDGFLSYGVDGWPITIKQGSPTAAFSTFTTVLQGTMRVAQIGQQSVTVKLRDRQGELEKPLQTTKYLGNNVAPAGVEGSADLKGKPKPLCFGRVLNVPAVCVNAQKQIYQVHDGSIQSLDAVYDRGVLLTGDIRSLSTRSFGGGTLRAGCYSPELALYVLVGDSGLITTSPDSITWTTQTNPLGTPNMTGVDWDPVLALFCAVASTGGILSSPNGKTWTALNSESTAVLKSVASSRTGVFVVVANAGIVLRSANGVSWTSIANGFAGTDIRCVTFGLSLGVPTFVCAGASGKIATSTDLGLTWTMRTSGVAQTLNAAAFGRDTFGITQRGAVNADAVVLTSTDGGVTWAARTPSGSIPGSSASTGLDGIAWVGVGFVVGSFDTTGLVLSDSRGLVWQWAYMGLNVATQYVVYGNGTTLFGTAGLVGSRGAGSSYITLTDLQDDTLAPSPGSYKMYLSGGYFRLGLRPDGLVTADVTEDTIQNRTTAQLFRKVLTRAAYSAADYSSADLAALDAVQPAECGWWGRDEINVNAVLDVLAASAWAWWGIDRTGLFRIQQVAEAGSAYVIAWTDNDVLLDSLTQIPPADDNNGLPTYRSVLQYAKNYAVQASDVAGSVSNDRLVFLAQQWRTVESNDASVPTAHKLSSQIAEDSLILNQTDAQGEVTRRQKIRGRRQDRFEMMVLFDATNGAVDLFQSVLLTHSRFGLSAGRLFRVIGLQPDGGSQKLKVRLWAAAATSDVIPSDIAGGRGIVPPGPSFLRGPRGQRFRRILA